MYLCDQGDCKNEGDLPFILSVKTEYSRYRFCSWECLRLWIEKRHTQVVDKKGRVVVEGAGG